MKNLCIILAVLSAGSAVFTVSCRSSYSPVYYSGGSSGTTIALDAVLTASGYRYVDPNGPVTLGTTTGITVTAAGDTTIVFPGSSLHPLYLDDGTTCGQMGTTSPVTMTFSTSGKTYNFHCGNHGACTNNSACPEAASSCSGMTGFVVVQ